MAGGWRIPAAGLVLALTAMPALPAPMTRSLHPQARPSGVTAQMVLPPAAPQALPPAATAPAGGATDAPAGAARLRPRPRPEGQTTAQTAESGAPLRPLPRPAGLAPAFIPAPDIAMTPVPRPLPRPAGLAAPPAAPADVVPVAAPQAEPRRSRGLFGLGKRQEPLPAQRGYVCGDPDLRGETLATIRSEIAGCGTEAPVRLTAVDGVRLSQPATLDCATATALKTWLNRGARPMFQGREIVELKIAASYICRPRNNVRGAKISEHGRGKAIDISGLVTSDGRTQMVTGGFDSKMRGAYRAACGIFGTTLGPGSDGYHEDHMHFDTASQRNGAYCR